MLDVTGRRGALVRVSEAEAGGAPQGVVGVEAVKTRFAPLVNGGMSFYRFVIKLFFRQYKYTS